MNRRGAAVDEVTEMTRREFAQGMAASGLALAAGAAAEARTPGGKSPKPGSDWPTYRHDAAGSPLIRTFGLDQTGMRGQPPQLFL